MTLPPSATLVRSDRPMAARIDDEVVMLDPQASVYYGLDDTASTIWDLLETPRTVDELCAELVARYDVDAERCRAEVAPFLDEMLKAELIQVDV